MRIEFRTEGGLAYFPGLSQPQVLDTATLPGAERAALETLVDAAHFFSRPARVGPTDAGAADHRTYTIRVEREGSSHTVEAIEPIADPTLQALVDALRTRLRAPPPRKPAQHGVKFRTQGRASFEGGPRRSVLGRLQKGKEPLRPQNQRATIV